MPIKQTQAQFIDKCRRMHGDRYCYDCVQYKNSISKITIGCPIHGYFEQIAVTHSQGHGCTKCKNELVAAEVRKRKGLTKEVFIERCKVIHANKYDYTFVDYFNTATKVIIVCFVHGRFLQAPAAHLDGHGCKKCGFEVTKEAIRVTKDEFINKAQTIHAYKYDYSLIDYKDTKKKVAIICREHGVFCQTPHNHMQGQGCSKCGNLRVSQNNRLSFDEFIERSNKVHFNKYIYDKVTFVNVKEHVSIICLEHGEFKQAPHNHMIGQGCPKCAHARGGLILNQKGRDKFVENANVVHGFKYNYNKTCYVDATTPVVIECSIHGEFKQKPNYHLSGNGCQECGKDYVTSLHRSNTEEFIEKATVVHNGKFIYDKVVYVNAMLKVEIGCKKCGKVFSQQPSNHLFGQGCPYCNLSKGEDKIRRYLEENNIGYKPQYTFKKSSIRRLRFDFAVNNGKVLGVIEFQGVQHYIPFSYSSDKTKDNCLKNLITLMKRDYLKQKWCEEHRVPLLVVPYWDRKRISIMLDDFFQNRSAILSQPPDIVKKYEPIRNKILERIESLIR